MPRPWVVLLKVFYIRLSAKAYYLILGGGD